MAAETNDNRRTFTAGGETYEYPDPFDLDLDEWVIIYDETKLILEDFAPLDDKAAPSDEMIRLEKELDGLKDEDPLRAEVFQQYLTAVAANVNRNGPRERARQEQLRNPALIKALAICGILRAHPGYDIDTAKKTAGQMKMLEVLKALAAGDDVDDPTQDSQSETDDSSLRTSDATNGSTSPDSPKSADEPEEEPAPTGTGG